MTVVGVAGAGVMGAGVAQVFASRGYGVVLLDTSPAVLEDARRRIRHGCRFNQVLGGPRLDPDTVLSQISTTTEVSDLAPAEIVVENVPENWEVKRALYGELDRVCEEPAIFVANTSAIPITRLASATARPDRVVGVHFMNPVPAKSVVELIPGHHTSAQTLARVRALLGDIGKRAVEVKDSCGFVSNRVLMLTINEAAFLLYEGVADARAVDEVFRGCFDHPMGPLETADLIGIDTILSSIEVLHEHFGDSKYRPCPLLRQMTEAGLLGRKSGQGFYPYGPAGK